MRADSDFVARGWSDEAAPVLRPSSVAGQDAVGATTPARSRGRGLAVAAAVLQLLAAATAVLGAFLAWQVHALTMPATALAVVREITTLLALVTAAAGLLAVVLVALTWCWWRGRPWARWASVALLLLAALPGLVAGVLPGVVMIAAAVLLLRADVGAWLRGRRRHA